MEIFKLVGSIMVDNDKANESIAKTDEKAEGLGHKLASGVKTAAKWGAGIAAAAGGVVASMTASAKAAAENMDVIDKGSQRMKISTKSYQELSHAAGLCGVEMSTMEKAAKKLEGTDLNFDDAMEQIYALTDAEERSALAAELFGESVAYQMTPMLNASAEEMAAMRQEANDLGLVMSEDAVKAGAEMNDSFSKIEGVIDGLKNEIGAAFMPVINELLKWIMDHMPQIKEFVGGAVDFVKGMIESLKPVIEALMPVFENIFNTISNLWENVLKPILTGILDFIGGVFTGNWEKIWGGLADIVGGIFNALIELVKMPINAIIKLLNLAIDGFNLIKIPDWVPLIGGFGINIPHIPLLAKGGDIEEAGTVLVGEKGPEFLDLPKGARVTPLDKGVGIDYDKLTKSIMNALTNMLPELRTVNTIVPDADGIFEIVASKSEENARLGRPGLVISV